MEPVGEGRKSHDGDDIEPRKGSVPRIVGVTGTSGGVGKTSFVAQCALSLAMGGQKVLVVDLNSGVSPLHSMLEVAPSGLSLRDFFNGRAKLQELFVKTSVESLSLIRYGILPYGQRGKRARVSKLVQRLKKLDFDTILLDLGMLSDSIKRDYFVHADSRVAILPVTGRDLENLTQLLLSSLIASFKCFAGVADGIGRAVSLLLNKYTDKPDITVPELGSFIDEFWPDLGGHWNKAVSAHSVNFVFNSVVSVEQLDQLKAGANSLLDSIDYKTADILFIPEQGTPSLRVPLAEQRNRFLLGAYPVIRSVVGIEPFNEEKQKDLLACGTDTDKQHVQTVSARELLNNDVDFEKELKEEKRRRMLEVEREVNVSREKEFSEMTRVLDKFTADHRKIAFNEIERELEARRAEMDKGLEQLRNDKIEEINRQVELHNTETTATMAADMDAKVVEMQKELASEKQSLERNSDEQLKEYYRNAKLNFDHETIQRRKRKERELEDEIQIKKKRELSKVESDISAEVDKIREMIWQELEEKRMARINQIDEMVDHYRRSRENELQRERNLKQSFMDKELHKEVKLLRESLMDDVFRDVMEVSADYDAEDFQNKIHNSEKMKREIEVERAKRKERLELEIASFKEQKEGEILELVDNYKKERADAFSNEMEELRRKMKSHVLKEAKSVKQKLLDKTIELTHKKRDELVAALGKERKRMAFELKREIFEARTKKQMGLKREMDILESNLQRGLDEMLVDEERRIAEMLEKKFAEKKRDKEIYLSKYLVTERGKKEAHLNEEIATLRLEMKENVNAERRVYRKDQEARLQSELSHMRELKLKKLDQEIQREIHNKTQSISLSLRDVEVAMRQEMHEKSAHEEVRLRRIMSADLKIEMSDLRRNVKRELENEEMRTRSQLKTYLETEKRKRLEAFEAELVVRKSQNDESIVGWREKEKSRLMREMLSKLGEEEKVHRELISSRLEYEKRKITDKLILQRNKAKKEEKLRLHEWVKGKRIESVSKVQKIIKLEYQKRIDDLKKKVLTERVRHLEELSRDMELIKVNKLTELNYEIRKKREDMLTAVDAEIREVKLKKESEMERYAQDEVKRIEERIDRRHRQIAAKKEEWLEFETRRRKLEMSEASAKEIELEKESQLQKHLMNLSIEVAERRRKNIGEVEREKANILTNLRNELMLRRKKMIQKMSGKVNQKVEARRKAMLEEIEKIKTRRRLDLEREVTEAKQGRLAAFENELEVEYTSRIEQLNTRLKTQEYVKRQEMIAQMLKKKTELDRFYEQEKKKYYDRLQNEIMRNQELSVDYLQEEIARLQKSWRLN